MKNGTVDNRMKLANYHHNLPQSKLLTGSTKDKFPIMLDDGKTIIFISDKSKEAETRLKYKMQRESRFHPSSAKPRS
jgi:hypothetical protein